MNVDRRHVRRRFLKSAAAAMATAVLPRSRAQPAGQAQKGALAAWQRSSAEPTFVINLGPFAPPPSVYNGGTVRDYSGSIYCPKRRAILMFGGGHAATPADAVLSFPLSRLIDGSGPDMQWAADYAPTPLETMALIDQRTVTPATFDSTRPRAELDLQALLGANGTMLRNAPVTIVDATGAAVTGFETFYWKGKRGVLFPSGTRAPQPFTVTFHCARHLTSDGFWKVDGEKPPLRPISRHTYEATIWSQSAERMLVLCGNNGASYWLPSPVADAATGGNCAAYDPMAREWRDTGIPGLGTQAVEDPVSRNILTFNRGTYAVYDPRTNTVVHTGDIGREVGFFAETYVYYPPTDRFYLVFGNTKDGPQRAVEFAVDRTTWKLAIAPIDDVNPRPRARSETTYRYDPVAKLIVGGIQQENDGSTYAYGFRPDGPGRGQWSRQRIPGGGGGTQFHHAVYVPELRAHAFLTSVDKRTDLLLWRPDPAKWSPTVGDTTPKASISAGGRTVASLQQACDIGGDIRLGAGTLRSQGAKITKPVRIRGEGRNATIIDGDGIAIEGKGVFDCWADASFVDLAIVNAAGAAGNVAAIRHEAGKLSLSGVTLRHCQNGILGGKPGEATLDMVDCDVVDCGIDESGATHGVYVSAIARASVRGCRFGNIHVGHYFKSRARENHLIDNVLGTDFGDTKSYNIDLCYGGRATITGNTLRQGAHCGNTCMISYGAEARFIAGDALAERVAAAGYVVEIRDNRFASTTGGIAFRNALPATITDVRIDIRDNTLAGLAAVAEGGNVQSVANAIVPAPA